MSGRAIAARRLIGAALAGALLAWAADVPTGAEGWGGSVASSDLAQRRMQSWIEDVVGSANPQLSAWTRERIARAVLRCGRDQGLEPDLVLAVLLVESSGRPDAYSPKGAVGLMQVMPRMYRALDLPGSAAHLEANVEAGCILLADNVRRLGEERGISAYFWGSAVGGEDYLERVRLVREALAFDSSVRLPSEG